MNKKILVGLIFILFLGIIFYAPQTHAAQTVEVENKIVLTEQERLALNQSLAALAETLKNLQVILSQNKTLPANTDQIIVVLGDISKSLAKITASVDARALVGVNAENQILSKSVAVNQNNAKPVVEKVDKFDSAQTEEENNDVGAQAPEETKSLMANIWSLIDGKIALFVLIISMIGIAVYIMKGKKEISQPEAENKQFVKV